MTKPINLNNILSNQSPKSIQITKIGNPVYTKNVTADIDIEKIITFLKSIKTEKKLNTQIKGWIYSINIVNMNGNSFNIELLGNTISYNNSFYTIDRNVVVEFANLYDTLNYSEVKPNIYIHPQ